MLALSTLEDRDTRLLGLAEAVLAAGYAFITPTPASHARVNARPENVRAHDLRGVFGWSRPFREGAIKPAMIDLMQAADVLEVIPGGYRSAVRFSTLEGLLFGHSAYPTVQEDAVFFGPDTYRFARAIRQFLPARVRRAVDIGCGAGPGAILIAYERPEAEVFAVDINRAALRMTRVNAALAGVRVEARRSDLLRGVDGTFDLIVANPPYLVDPGARTYRHGGGALGADLSLRILETAIDRLGPGGTLLLYTGSAIVDGVDAFLAESRTRLAGTGLAWTYEEVDADVFGEELEQGVYAAAERIAAVLLTARKKD
jgi:methylase of polypeptide subunit release factors